jgi:hypothetical protein
MKKTRLLLAFVLGVLAGCGNKKPGPDAGLGGAGGAAGAGGVGGHGGATMPTDGSVGDTPTDTPPGDAAVPTFTVGGTIAGLTGTGLVLQDNGGDDLVIPAGATTFTFATPLATGAPYAVTIVTQPSSPTQVCTVTAGTGVIGTANVGSVVINCLSDSFTIGGTIVGLTGTGLVLQDNGGDDLMVPAGATTFTFPKPLATGTAYTVTVLTQPTGPSQVCTVDAGNGIVAGAGITDVAIACVPKTFAVGGTITGLAGTGLVLQDNAGDNLTVPANATTFTFAKPIPSGEAYAVTVLAQPSGPAQTCTVSAGNGAIGAADVSSVSISCVTKTFPVGGTISGLTGTGLVLQDNGGDNLTVPANATSFTFAKSVPSGSAFAVTVLTQPTSPPQNCVISGGTGNVGSAPITSVVINCAPDRFTVGGQIMGLRGPVVLHNGSDNQTVSADGMFAFPTPIASGATYAVTVATQPTSPSQTCVVTNGSGTVGTSNVTNVMVTCTTNAFHVMAAVSGLTGTGLILWNNTEPVLVNAPGTVTFPSSLPSGSSYVVTVISQPGMPSQVCTVGANGAGVIGDADVTVPITCVLATYRVRVTVSGLAGSGLALKSGPDSVSVSAPSTFYMPTRVASGSTYQVTVAQQPTSPSQTCTVTPAVPAVVGGADVLATVACATNSFHVTGMVTGLSGSGLVLQNNAGNDLPVSPGATSFTFPNPVPSGSMFNVSVKTQPTSPTQMCSVTGGMGTIGNGDTMGVTIACSTPLYTVSAHVIGLTGSGLVLQDNGADSLPIPGNNVTLPFATKLSMAQTFSVSVATPPSNPAQTCTVVPATGPITGDVTVLVDCAGPHTIGGSITGLTQTGLILRDNGADDLNVPLSSTTFSFATRIASGDSYAVSVAASPPDQLCSVTANASGPVSGADISNVAVDCAICAVWPEQTSGPIVSCPPGQTVASFDFVSFGTPTGTCGNFAVSSCDSATSRSVVEAACLGQQSCAVNVSIGSFGDPCPGANKTLTLQAHCH